MTEDTNRPQITNRFECRKAAAMRLGLNYHFATEELAAYYAAVRKSSDRALGIRFKPGDVNSARNITTAGDIFTNAMYLAMHWEAGNYSVYREENDQGVSFVFTSKTDVVRFSNVELHDFDVYLGLESMMVGLASTKIKQMLA